MQPSFTILLVQCFMLQRSGSFSTKGKGRGGVRGAEFSVYFRDSQV